MHRILILPLRRASKLPLTPESRHLLQTGRIRSGKPKYEQHELSDWAVLVLARVQTLRKWRILMAWDWKAVYPPFVPFILRQRARWHFMTLLSHYLLRTRVMPRSSVKASLRMLRWADGTTGFSRGFRDH